MSFSNFLDEKMYAVSAALFILGLFLKQTPKIKNWTIPYILTALSVFLCNLSLGFSINATVQGILAAGVSVYVHQLGKNCSPYIKLNSGNSLKNNKSEGCGSK